MPRMRHKLLKDSVKPRSGAIRRCCKVSQFHYLPLFHRLLKLVISMKFDLTNFTKFLIFNTC